MRTCCALLAILVLMSGCSDDPGQTADSTAGPDTWAAGDLPQTATQDTATNATADSASETAGDAPGDATADATVDATLDATVDATLDAQADSSAADTPAETVADVVPDVPPLPDAPPPDLPPPQDVPQDAPPPDLPPPPPDVPPPPPDVPPPPQDVPPTPDVSPPPACKAGEKARCWIECPIAYTTGCIDGGLNPKIMGLRSCEGGQWSKCQANTLCSALGPGPCQSGVNLDVTYPCLDGTQKAGKYLCSKALGANCTSAWYINWPISDCPHFCAQAEAGCDSAGAEKPCEILCGGPDGPIVPGKQKCQDGGCGFNYWSQCFGDKPCPPPPK